MQFGIEFEYALGSPLSFHRWRHNKTITASGAFISCAEKCAFLIPSIPLDSMNTSSVIIDDTDTQIQYSPGWQQGGSTNEYKGTTTNAETKGAFFELKFIGTSITVYGTLALHSSSNSTYTVDGGEPFPFRSKGDNLVHYQKIFYTSPPLPYMEHTLVGNCTDDGAPVILDYFLIETPLNFLTNTTSPPPSICESKPAPPTAIIIGSVLGGFALLATIFASVIVDNADTQITYSPGWKEDGSPNEYKRTTTNAVMEGASFSLNFTGTSITVYGTLNTDSSPNSTYVLDGGEPFPFASNQASSVRYQQIFYASPAVPYKEHTLVGTCVSGRVILDYFVIETPFDSPHTPLPKPEEPDSPFNQRVPAVPTAAIIGGVLGGLVFLIALLAFYLWYRGPLTVDRLTTVSLGCMLEWVIKYIVDDADARIRYSPGWRRLGSPNEFMDTSTCCSQRGDNFTFHFFGTSINVYGTLARGQARQINTTNIAYILDGGKPEPPEHVNLTSDIRYQQLMYSSTSLSHKEHTLVGICGSEDPTGTYLDYFVVETHENLSENHKSCSMSASPTSAHVSETVVPSRATSGSSPSNPSTATIVGSVTGGFAAIFAIGVLYLWLRRYKGSVKRPAFRSSRLPYLPYFPNSKPTAPRSEEASSHHPLTSIPSAYDGGHKSITSQYATSPTLVQRPTSPGSGRLESGGYSFYQGY
ncbi:hypothetical protein EYR40_010137 [Pleurotus pulmonarius]|nr:hypothetical protein EYR40_010137 [Pleurotus pulmonarius]